LVEWAAASADRDLAWVARENLRTRRLARLDPVGRAVARAPLILSVRSDGRHELAQSRLSLNRQL
jgi:hypothetical protein